jgi:hypothetical protein
VLISTTKLDAEQRRAVKATCDDLDVPCRIFDLRFEPVSRERPAPADPAVSAREAQP